MLCFYLNQIDCFSFDAVELNIVNHATLVLQHYTVNVSSKLLF